MTEYGESRLTPHLEVHEVVCYVERNLTPADRERLEAHLADCDACTAEVAQLWRLRSSARRGRWLAFGAAAAAVLAGVVLLSPGARAPGGEGPLVRDGVPDDGPALLVITPPDGATVEQHPAMVWHSVSGATTYRVVVTAENGDSVWSGSTRDTAIVLTPGVALERTRRYLWYVDALLSNGRWATSGVHEFRTGP